VGPVEFELGDGKCVVWFINRFSLISWTQHTTTLKSTFEYLNGLWTAPDDCVGPWSYTNTPDHITHPIILHPYACTTDLVSLALVDDHLLDEVLGLAVGVGAAAHRVLLVDGQPLGVPVHRGRAAEHQVVHSVCLHDLGDTHTHTVMLSLPSGDIRSGSVHPDLWWIGATRLGSLVAHIPRANIKQSLWGHANSHAYITMVCMQSYCVKRRSLKTSRITCKGGSCRCCFSIEVGAAEMVQIMRAPTHTSSRFMETVRLTW